jgi:defect-in-organelle-trafficking protein DotC
MDTMDNRLRFLGLLGILWCTTACTPVFDPRANSFEADAEVRKGLALSFGAQSGLAYKAGQINNLMESRKVELDKVYNFNALMMANNMLPPVVQESRNTLNVDSSDTMRMADSEIQIIRPAQLVTAAPTWRDYLILNYNKPEPIDESMLPRTPQERRAWQESYAKGWAMGVKQASDIFSQALGMLGRDFNGMVLYHTLVTKNMMSKAYTAKAQLGVTGDENMMRINDQIVRITESAKLRPQDIDEWQAIVEMNDG